MMMTFILGLAFHYKKTFEKNLCSVSTAASQRLILRKSWRVSIIGCSSRVAFGVLSFPFWSTGLKCGARLLFCSIRCNQMHLRYGALPVPCVTARVTRGAFHAHKYTYAPPR